MNDYQQFLTGKLAPVQSAGVDVPRERLHPALFGFQADLVRWSLRKGRAALFASTGLGKTLMALAWAQHAGRRVLILAPLAVAQQTVREGEKWGVPVTYARAQREAPPTGIVVTNYERLARFTADAFDAVILDESSILKSLDGKTRTALIEAFAATPMRLCCTATPAPNDISEIGNHAEFLGVLSTAEMKAAFFINDERTRDWRLKGHARRPFFRWLASWGMALTKPSDLAYPDDGYVLPPLNVHPIFVETNWRPEGQLFVTGLRGVGERAAVRRETQKERVERALALVRAEPNEKWLVWCGLNAEQEAVARALGARCVSIEGALTADEKVRRELRWREGDVPVLVTKPAVFGWGMNWQHCARMVFVGLNDSWEMWFQSVRRCWRFNQRRPVEVSVVLADAEETIWRNVMRKEREAAEMTAALVAQAAEFERAELSPVSARAEYEARRGIILPPWLTEGGAA